jgi:hypothetical protein
MAGWFARLLETVVLDNFSRSAIACWFTEELIWGRVLEVSGTGANLRGGAFARGVLLHWKRRIMHFGCHLTSGKIVMHADGLFWGMQFPESRNLRARMVRFGAPQIASERNATGDAHED